MALETATTAEELTVVDKNSEVNVTRFLQAVGEGRRQCYVEAFDLLYRTFGQGRSYATLHEFFVQAMGWKKHQLANLLYQAQLGGVASPCGSSDGEECLVLKRDTLQRQSSTQSSLVFSELTSPFGGSVYGSFNSSLENATLHLIQPVRKKKRFQRSHSVPKEIRKTKVTSNSSNGAVLEHLHSTKDVSEEHLMGKEYLKETTFAIKETVQNLPMVSEQPQKTSQSVTKGSCKDPQSKLQSPRRSSLVEGNREYYTGLLKKQRRASQISKESSQKPKSRSDLPRKVSQSLRETNNRLPGKLEATRNTSQSLREPSRIPHLKSSTAKTISQPVKKNSQKYQVKPDSRKDSKSQVEANQNNSVRANRQGKVATKVTTRPSKTIAGTKFTKKQISRDDSVKSSQESGDVMLPEEKTSCVTSSKQSVKQTNQASLKETSQKLLRETSQEPLKETSQKPLKKTDQKPQGRLQSTRNVLSSNMDATRIPHAKPSVGGTVPQPVRKNGQKQQIRPNTNKSFKYQEDAKKKSLVRVKNRESVTSNTTVHSPKLVPGTRFRVRKISEDQFASSKQETSHVTLSKQETNPTPLAKQGTGCTLASEQEIRQVGTGKYETNLVSEFKQDTNFGTPSNQETNHIHHIPVTRKDICHTSISELEAEQVSTPSMQEIREVPLSKQDTNQGAPSTQETSHVPLSVQETSDIASSRQEINQASLPTKESKQMSSSIEERSQVSSLTGGTCHIFPSDEEDIIVLSSEQEPGQDTCTQLEENTVCISNIIYEANQTLKEPGEIRENLLSAEPDGNQLPQKALVLLLMNAFPQLPPKARTLIEQLQQFSSIVCYRDMEFNNEQLSLRLQDFSCLIADLIHVVISCCKEMTEKYIKETSDKLRTAKKKLRSAQNDYEDHLSWVIQTQQELTIAERNLQEAKMKNVSVLKVYSRSQSQESKASSDNKNSKVCGIVGCLEHPVNAANSANINDSVNNLLDGDKLEPECVDPVCDTDSLLLSVMKEVAVIEKKHSSASESDRQLKQMLRNTQESVIETKKEVRSRLDSNVSAEEVAIAKEDVLSEKQSLTKKFSRALKNLQSDYKALQMNARAIISSITENIETMRTMELDEESLRLGQLIVRRLREQESGRLIMESRQDAVAFASLVKIPDLGEWLMMKHDITKQVQQVYSNLKVKDSKNTVSILDVVGAGDNDPSVVVLCGPVGSGKSCMCHYLLHQWKANKCLANSKLHRLDLVLYCAMESIMLSGSWSQFLRGQVFCTTLNDFPNLDIHEALANMSVLFLVDMGILTLASSEVLKEIFTHLGKNRVVVTSRPETEAGIVALAKDKDLSCLSAKLCPMTSDAITDYSTQLISFFEQQTCSVHDKVKNFIKLLHSMNPTDNLLYPLPLTYLMYLWRIDPGHALRAKTLSRLFIEVVVVCEHTLVEVIHAKSGGDRSAAKVRAEQYTRQLYEAAWKLVTHQNWPHHNHTILPPQHPLLQDQTVFGNFDPLLVVREGTNGRRQGDLPHHSLAEVLCGFHLAHQRLRPFKGSPLFRRQEKLEKYCIPDIKRFRFVFPHAAGALVYNKHSVEDAKEVATLFSKSLPEERDMVSWLVLLRECDFLSTMCTAVSGLLTRYSCWTTSNHSQQNNCAVADLLRKGAYQPRQIVISQPLQEGIKCIIHALSTCSSTLVHLRQDSQFYNWGEVETCDSLVVPLQPPGTLHECWGHLGVEGAMALRHSHHLEELNVRISSCDALSALVHSMDHIRRSLRYLYLRLDLVPSSPLSSLQSLNFKGKELWLRVWGITDASLDWLKSLIKILSSWYTEIVLEESNLSPSELQALKESMPQTPVHITR